MSLCNSAAVQDCMDTTTSWLRQIVLSNALQQVYTDRMLQCAITER